MKVCRAGRYPAQHCWFLRLAISARRRMTLFQSGTPFRALCHNTNFIPLSAMTGSRWALPLRTASRPEHRWDFKRMQRLFWQEMEAAGSGKLHQRRPSGLIFASRNPAYFSAVLRGIGRSSHQDRHHLAAPGPHTFPKLCLIKPDTLKRVRTDFMVCS